MGTLIYGPQALEIELDDRVLAHLRVVVLSKLRRAEAFSLSWIENESTGHGRSSIWLHPAVPVRFRFRETAPPHLNRAWIDQMMEEAGVHGELVLGPEPAPSQR